MAEIQGHLSLIGYNFEPNRVTDKIGHPPTWLKRKNDILNNGRLFGHSEWGVATEVFIADDISQVTNALMNILPCTSHDMAQISRDFNAKWHILFSISINKDFPVITIPSIFSKFAWEIDATIGFDVI